LSISNVIVYFKEQSGYPFSIFVKKQ
jgi:hypothetical protein